MNLRGALEYLADDLGIEGENHEGYEQCFEQLADFTRSLKESDELAVGLAKCLDPFLIDDDRLGGALYPQGKAFEFLEIVPPGGVGEECLREYLGLFSFALHLDFERWNAHIEEVGEEVANWQDSPPLIKCWGEEPALKA